MKQMLCRQNGIWISLGQYMRPFFTFLVEAFKEYWWVFWLSLNKFKQRKFQVYVANADGWLLVTPYYLKVHVPCYLLLLVPRYFLLRLLISCDFLLLVSIFSSLLLLVTQYCFLLTTTRYFLLFAITSYSLILDTCF